MGLPHIGPLEIGLIVVLVLIIFGVGKLPQVGGAIGKSIREFRHAQSGEDEKDSSLKEGKES
jgi:sec-independent protein translocase protein TatA